MGPSVTGPSVIALDSEISQGLLNGSLGFASSPEAKRLKRDGEVVEDSSVESGLLSSAPEASACLWCRGF